MAFYSYDSEELRLATFWPIAYRIRRISYIRLSKAGFRYDEITDSVVCCGCNNIFEIDEVTNLPFNAVYHRQGCSSTNLDDSSYVDKGDVSFSEWNYVASVAVYDYSRERFSLLRSFEGWPQYLSLSPQLLADNGYFFTGVRDFISCCQCGTVRHPSEEGIEEFKKNLHCIRCIADYREEAQRSSNLENQRQRKVNIGTSVLENQIVASTSKYKTHSSQNTFQQSDFVTMSQIGESLSPEYAAALSSHISDFTVPSTAVFSPHTSSAMSIQNINIPAFPNYVRKSERLKSFHQWPISHIAHPADLANAGFFYEGYPDVVRCFWCGLQHQSWRMGDDPKAIHANLRPECPCLHKDPASANDSAKDLAIRFMER